MKVLFALHIFYWNECHSVVSDSLPPHVLYSPWNSPGQNTGVDSPSPGDLPNLGIKPRSPTWGRILYQLSHQGSPRIQLSHQGSPRILKWVADPFSSGSSRPRNWTRVSCIAGRFFTNWAIREAPNILLALFLWSRKDLEILSCKASGNKCFRFYGQMVSSTAAQLCPCSVKIILDDM